MTSQFQINPAAPQRAGDATNSSLAPSTRSELICWLFERGVLGPLTGEFRLAHASKFFLQVLSLAQLWRLSAAAPSSRPSGLNGEGCRTESTHFSFLKSANANPRPIFSIELAFTPILHFSTSAPQESQVQTPDRPLALSSRPWRLSPIRGTRHRCLLPRRVEILQTLGNAQ